MEWSIIRYGEVESTNETAKVLAHEKASEGTVVVAEVQKTGRGRMGREWYSPKGGLWFSMILRPKFHPSEAGEMMGLCSVTVASVIEDISGIKASVKSPNDILVNGKKICGILVEEAATLETLQWMVIGVGVNANFSVSELPETIRQHATTIYDETGSKIDLEHLLREILDNFSKEYCEFVC